jgi:hypothetical protein
MERFTGLFITAWALTIVGWIAVAGGLVFALGSARGDDTVGVYAGSAFVASGLVLVLMAGVVRVAISIEQNTRETMPLVKRSRPS